MPEPQMPPAVCDLSQCVTSTKRLARAIAQIGREHTTKVSMGIVRAMGSLGLQIGRAHV